jgi:hypothetical protein
VNLTNPQHWVLESTPVAGEAPVAHKEGLVPPGAPRRSQLRRLGPQCRWRGGVHEVVDVLCIIPDAFS